jgi:hypothetical protein
MNSDEVDVIFPRAVGAEIDISLRTLQDLPENLRPRINDHLKTLISEKRTALAAVMNRPGNTDAYFHIGMLFMWEMIRINIAGTMPERMSSVNTVYQTPEGSTVVGLAAIGSYFIKKYLDNGGSDPACITIARGLGVLK